MTRAARACCCVHECISDVLVRQHLKCLRLSRNLLFVSAGEVDGNCAERTSVDVARKLEERGAVGVEGDRTIAPSVTTGQPSLRALGARRTRLDRFAITTARARDGG